MQLMKPIDVDSPMAMYFKRVQDIRDLAEAINQPLDQVTLVTIVYNRMKDNEVFDWDTRMLDAMLEV